MKRNQRGFGVVEGLLVVAAVGLIGFVGWFVWNSKNNTEKNLTSPHSASKATDNADEDSATDPHEPIDTVEEKGEKLAIMDGSVTMSLYDWTLDSHSIKAFWTSNDEGDVRLNCSEQATIILPKRGDEPSSVHAFVYVCGNQDSLSPTDYYKKYQSIYGRGKPDIDEQKTLKVDGHNAFERFTKRDATTGPEASYASIGLDYMIEADDDMLWIYTTFTSEDTQPEFNKVIESIDFKD